MADKENLQVFGVEVERRWTVANLVQVGLLLFAIINGAYWIYFGFKSQFSDLVATQIALAGRQEELEDDMEQLDASIQSRITSADTEFESTSARIANHDAAIGVMNANASNMSVRLTEFGTKLDRLDALLRSYIIDSGRHDPT